MEITLTQHWSSESLAWNYHDIFWAEAKSRLSDFAYLHELDDMVRLFDIIIEFCGTDIISETEMNNIIGFDWDYIMKLYNGEEE